VTEHGYWSATMQRKRIAATMITMDAEANGFSLIK